MIMQIFLHFNDIYNSKCPKDVFKTVLSLLLDVCMERIITDYGYDKKSIYEEIGKFSDFALEELYCRGIVSNWRYWADKFIIQTYISLMRYKNMLNDKSIITDEDMEKYMHISEKIEEYRQILDKKIELTIILDKLWGDYKKTVKNIVMKYCEVSESKLKLALEKIKNSLVETGDLVYDASKSKTSVEYISEENKYDRRFRKVFYNKNDNNKVYKVCGRYITKLVEEEREEVESFTLIIKKNNKKILHISIEETTLCVGILNKIIEKYNKKMRFDIREIPICGMSVNRALIFIANSLMGEEFLFEYVRNLYLCLYYRIIKHPI